MIRAALAMRRRLHRDLRGSAAVEFALIAPVLILFYFGVAEYCQALMAERKASHVAASVGDLVAQTDALTTAQMTDIFNISGMLLAPFPSSQISMCVSQISLTNSTTANVDWVQPYQGATCTAKNTNVFNTLPKSTITPTQPFINVGESVIYSQAFYTYVSPVKYLIKSNINFTEAFYMRPRKSTTISMN